MQVHTLPKQVGIGLLLAVFLNSACALPRPPGQPKLNPDGAPSMATRPEPGVTSSARARISPEEAVTLVEQLW
ncbi:MAG: hypothetical protein HY268_06555 [Deltaproteobacteria bacterium]|nr:hypothetical protein [Deltaproteobacteria bacterium]